MSICLFTDLLVNTRYPYNAEGQLRQLTDNWITPIGKHFVRNHCHVPNIDPQVRYNIIKFNSYYYLPHISYETFSGIHFNHNWGRFDGNSVHARRPKDEVWIRRHNDGDSMQRKPQGGLSLCWWGDACFWATPLGGGGNWKLYLVRTQVFLHHLHYY